MEKRVNSYGYCVPFVINVLKDLRILPKSIKYQGVDDLFFALSKYRFAVEDIKQFFKKEENEIKEMVIPKKAE